jgi:hypothetical protein
MRAFAISCDQVADLKMGRAEPDRKRLQSLWMFDPASITAALGSAKAILDLLKNVTDTQLAIKINSEVANVQGKLIDVQQQALALQMDNQQLRAEIEKFRSHVQHHSVIWRIRPDGTEDGPFCPACVAEGRDMRLILRPHVDQTQTHWHLYCPNAHVSVGGTRDLGRGREPTYVLPKELVPENYFFLR